MWKQRSDIRKRFLTVFLSGFAAGVLYMVVFGRAVVHETTLLSRYFFSKYQQVEFASGELLFAVLKSRLGAVTLLWLTGFTVFGRTAAFLALAWTGLALGVTWTAAAMKLGFAGILVCLAASLPQALIYVPAAVWFLRKVCEMWENREWKSPRHSGGRGGLMFYVSVLAAGILLFFLGAWAESYVNPLFLKTVLKNI